MQENDICIAGIGQAILELLTFKVGSRNYQGGISFRNFRKSEVRFTENDVTSDKSQSQSLKSKIFSKPCKI